MSELSTIKMNYREALRQAERLDQAADIMEKQGISRMEEVIADIGGLWTGENSELFRSRCGSLQESVAKTVKKTRQSAETIRRIARNTYEAEMRNYEIAKKRTYS